MAAKTDWGIQDNATKGQSMTNAPITKLNKFHKGHGTKLPVNDTHIQVSTAATYLGTSVQMNAQADKAVQHRLSLASTAYDKYRHIWKSGTISIAHKMQIYLVAIRSVLLYSLECHYLTRTHEKTT